MKTPHTCCCRGKRVRIVKRDGSVIVDKFVERTGKFIVLESGRIRGGDIKSFTIQKADQQ